MVPAEEFGRRIVGGGGVPPCFYRRQRHDFVVSDCRHSCSGLQTWVHWIFVKNWYDVLTLPCQFFPNRKQLYISRGLSYHDEIWFGRHSRQ